MTEANLYTRELSEGEAEYRYYLSCYEAPRKRENRLLGALAAFGSVLVLGAIMLGGGGL
jgi:hypothetical protein